MVQKGFGSAWAINCNNNSFCCLKTIKAFQSDYYYFVLFPLFYILHNSFTEFLFTAAFTGWNPISLLHIIPIYWGFLGMESKIWKLTEKKITVNKILVSSVFKQTISTSLDKHLRNNKKDFSPYMTCSPWAWLCPVLIHNVHEYPAAATQSMGQIPYSQYTSYL